MDISTLTQVQDTSFEDMVAVLDREGIGYDVYLTPKPHWTDHSGFFRISEIRLDGFRALDRVAALVEGGRRWTRNGPVTRRKGLYIYAEYALPGVDFEGYTGIVRLIDGLLFGYNSPKEGIEFDGLLSKLTVRNGHLLERTNLTAASVIA